jgi:metal-responsive CopG/Arc/MetJ family transcriptional regulator
MATMQLKKPDQGKVERIIDTTCSFYESMLREIDEIRGDTSRSLWMRRAAAKELERQKNEQNKN